MTFLPEQTGLYEPEYEHDNCGVGFIVNIKGEKSHEIIRNGLTILKNMEHRGATGNDPDTGDGAGITIQLPHEFLSEVTAKIDIELPQVGEYGMGLIFLPQVTEDRHIIESIFERIVFEEGQKFLGWRDVPTNPEVIGKVARVSMPVFKQVFIAKGRNTATEEFKRKLYTIRKRVWYEVQKENFDQKSYFYVCSLSTDITIYKGQLKSDQLDKFFPDLYNEKMKSALALVHSRYSTNTFPSWALAHPFRLIAHNGEINTLKGNINWFKSRENLFRSKFFKDDLKKIKPIVAPSKSDSATFDNALEFLVLNGRTLPHALLMMVPEAWSGDKLMDKNKKEFYKYHACLMEPWDGPASISFTDGRYIGSILDRNGLRPGRYWVTDDNRVIMASEAGVLDVKPEKIIEKGRLEPGKMFLIDIEEGRIISDKEIKDNLIKSKSYTEWVSKNLIDIDSINAVQKDNTEIKGELIKIQIANGFCYEDIKTIIKPMAEKGKEPLGSMGNDTPLAVLSEKPQLIYNYFHQLFAQVTNPPIDAIREEIIMSKDVFLGAEENLLEDSENHCKRLWIKSPILKKNEFNKVKNNSHFKVDVINAIFNKREGFSGLKKRIKEIKKEIVDKIYKGTSIIILSNNGIDKDKVPIPSLLITSSVHHYLIGKGIRNKVSLIMKSSDAREVHHFALLIGYGANAVFPFLSYTSIEDEFNKNSIETKNVKEAIDNYVSSIEKGLYKIMSKMGISTVQSYCGAQIFEAIGLNKKFIEKYFKGTTSRLGGIGLKEIYQDLLKFHDEAFNKREVSLRISGYYKWRKGSEYHQYNPEMIAKLQKAIKLKDYSLFKEFSNYINEENSYKTIRGLLDFRKRKSISLDEVEPVENILKRFSTGAMSYGSISKEAHETLAIAMNKIGGYSNTGEGGEDPARYIVNKDGNSRRSRIKQIAQGRFGVNIEYLVNADQLQIKMAQGAKPGEGGHLPGHKVSKEIAKTRNTIPGVGLISPPPHHDIYSIEDLKELIYDLKNANAEADISVKLVSEVGIGTVAAGVAKGKADLLVVSGYEGGTGASPLTSIKRAGIPLEMGLSEVQQVLVMNGLRQRVRVQGDGQLKTARDVVIAAMLGADEFGFATIALAALGCVLQRQCHLNSCSVGIATQDPELRKFFTGKPEDVITYFRFLGEEIRELMAELGFRKFEDLIGKVDLLESKDLNVNEKIKKLDLSGVIHRPDVPAAIPLRNLEKQNHELDNILDYRLIESSRKALQEREDVKFSCKINNVNRAVGTMLSSHIAKNYGLKGLKEDRIVINFFGTAGQSFGAFLANGVTFILEGDANDYVGKGLSGGKIIIKPEPNANYKPCENIIAGNVCLYGATKGSAYIRGKVGERFCVRNSGVNAVVEGVGDHGCEYMTGGLAVILGSIGRNFAAGMSGGLAFIYNKKDSKDKINTDMVDIISELNEYDKKIIKNQLEKHFDYTESEVAKEILINWELEQNMFIKIFPKEYQKVFNKEMITDFLLEENLSL